MSDRKDNTDNKMPAYPPPAYIRTPHCQGVQVEHPGTSRQQLSSEKSKSLDWLTEAAKHEPPKPSTEEGTKPDNTENGKEQNSNNTGNRSLSWLFEADRYNPPKNP
ncbi:hypothetical protein NPX13_g1829 [Xylaria arbuscula]|uniref:Uncharacterized protein n=1 Tax=Xylaria arbuscula TaxID=114810 RepID=A0A9W8NKW6_9PEZI|nr:hypothetical protein NPX13_g1829 [Xylaria arbuscula]